VIAATARMRGTVPEAGDLDFLCTLLRDPRVVAFTMPGNAASRRVMEKLGMTYEKTFEHGRWGPHVLCSIEPDAARRDG